MNAWPDISVVDENSQFLKVASMVAFIALEETAISDVVTPEFVPKRELVTVPIQHAPSVVMAMFVLEVGELVEPRRLSPVIESKFTPIPFASNCIFPPEFPKSVAVLNWRLLQGDAISIPLVSIFQHVCVEITPWVDPPI